MASTICINKDKIDKQGLRKTWIDHYMDEFQLPEYTRGLINIHKIPQPSGHIMITSPLKLWANFQKYII